MPTVTEKPIRAFAHCPDPRCRGTAQVEVEAFERETSYTFRDGGGDLPGVERSKVEPVFANEDDQACPHCADARARDDLQPRLRELSLTPRKQYSNVSGFAQDHLLGAKAFEEAAKKTPAEEEMAAMRAELAAMRAEMTARKGGEE